MNELQSRAACIGLRAKTARAIAVVVSGPGSSLHAVARAELVLATPATPELFQPYHLVMELPWDRASAAAGKSQQAIAEVAVQQLKSLSDDLHSRNIEVACVAVVGAPERKLASIGSPHIRAHAAEGVLFRRVWQLAAETIGMPSMAFPEKGIEAQAAADLQLPVSAVRSQLAEFGYAMGRPWRADEKAAAMAAWIALNNI
jgi:hypothetical protein